MLRSFDSLDRDHRGYERRGALLGVVESLSYPARTQDDRLLLRRTAGLAGALREPRHAHRRRQPRQYHDLRRRRARPAREEHRRRRCGRRWTGFVDERSSQLATGVDHDQPAADDGVRARRRHDEARFAHRAGAAGRGYRRVPHRRTERPLVRLPAHRRRQPVPLPADLLADEHRLRRQVPRDPRRRSAAGRRKSSPRKGYRAVACARRADAASYELPALALLDRDPAAERVPDPRRRLQLPDPRAPG